MDTIFRAFAIYSVSRFSACLSSAGAFLVVSRLFIVEINFTITCQNDHIIDYLVFTSSQNLGVCSSYYYNQLGYRRIWFDLIFCGGVPLLSCTIVQLSNYCTDYCTKLLGCMGSSYEGLTYVSTTLLLEM